MGAAGADTGTGGGGGLWFVVCGLWLVVVMAKHAETM